MLCFLMNHNGRKSSIYAVLGYMEIKMNVHDLHFT